jgi:hypothetical protein
VELTGWIATVEPDPDDAYVRLLGLATRNGSLRVHVPSDADIRHWESRTPLPPEQLAAGQEIDLEAIVLPDASLEGRRLYILPPSTAAASLPVMRGRIMAILPGAGGDQGVLLLASGARTDQVVVGDGADVRDASGRPIAFGDLRVGQYVEFEVESPGGLGIRTRIIRLLTLPRPVRVTFEGVVYARFRPDVMHELWMVGSVPVYIDADTQLGPEVDVGVSVLVTAERREDGQLRAIWIGTGRTEPEAVALRGRLERIDGSEWTVDGRVVDVSNATITGQPVIGALVQISGYIPVGGGIVAERVDILAEGRVQVEFSGPIESVSEDGELLVVASYAVRLTPETQRSGAAPAVGHQAWVRGYEANPVEALFIHVDAPTGEAVSFDGVLTETSAARPSMWAVQLFDPPGEIVRVQVSQDTIVDQSAGPAQPGATVTVEARDRGGVLEAARIRVRR